MSLTLDTATTPRHKKKQNVQQMRFITQRDFWFLNWHAL